MPQWDAGSVIVSEVVFNRRRKLDGNELESAGSASLTVVRYSDTRGLLSSLLTSKSICIG